LGIVQPAIESGATPGCTPVDTLLDSVVPIIYLSIITTSWTSDCSRHRGQSNGQ
jgi:hypothetical protein